MPTLLVHINFDKMNKALTAHIREKAMRFNNTIVYLKDGVIVKENPTSKKYTIVKNVSLKKK